MNIIKKLLFIIPAAGMLAVSCTDVEKMEVDHIGGYNTMNNAESEAYYENLRNYKKTSENHARSGSVRMVLRLEPYRNPEKRLSLVNAGQHGYRFHVVRRP